MAMTSYQNVDQNARQANDSRTEITKKYCQNEVLMKQIEIKSKHLLFTQNIQCSGNFFKGANFGVSQQSV